jgi:hypothetical protein
MGKFALKPTRIETSFRTLKKHLTRLKDGLNKEAAAQMKAGQYEKVKALMDVGTLISNFTSQVDEVAIKWRAVSEDVSKRVEALGVGTGAATGRSRTSARELCIPALRAVVGRGGKAGTSDIILDLEAGGLASFTPADLEMSRQSRLPKWRSALQKAYLLSQRRKWIEKRADDIWVVTALGRNEISGSEQT